MSFVTTLQRTDLIETVAEWIWTAFWRDAGYSLADLCRRVAASRAERGPDQCFVLLVDGVPVGTAGLIADDLAERPDLTPWLAAVFVCPWARGRGYARVLIRAVEDACAAADIRRLWLHTSTAERLYASAGWRSVDTIARESGAAVLMCRDITQGNSEPIDLCCPGGL